MKRKAIYLGTALLLCIGIVYSCSKGSSGSPANPGGGGTTVTNAVQIQNFAFSPSKITVSAGTTVTWTNKDAVAHTVTELNGAFDSGSVSTNGTYKFTFSTAGTYTYHCTIHSMMQDATVTVTK